MKDKQATPAPAAHAIPLISPVLHCLSMPALVFLRHGFGYSFLRPKSIFLASAFASFLLSYMVWKEPTFQPVYADLAKFATIASTFYLLHLCQSFWRETRGEGEHDQYSGKSHLLKFLPEQSEKNIHLIMEPAITIIAGFIFDGKLGSAVFLIGVSLLLKESIGAWLKLRHSKRLRDNLNDAEDSMTSTNPGFTAPLPVRTTRKPRARRPRQTIASNPTSDEERRYAEILRMMPPYTLETALNNYHALILAEHPDHHGGSAAANQRAQELNEAAEYFRTRESTI